MVTLIVALFPSFITRVSSNLLTEEDEYFRVLLYSFAFLVPRFVSVIHVSCVAKLRKNLPGHKLSLDSERNLC